MDTFLQLNDVDLIAAESAAGSDLDGRFHAQAEDSDSAPKGFFSGLQGFQLRGAESGRERFLARADTLERQMDAAEDDVEQRIAAMQRILELKDPMEQLAEYIALSQEPRLEPDTDIVADLVQCAEQIEDEDDQEIALIGAFFFQCDRSAQPKNRDIASLLPVVAAMMEASSGMEHPPF